MSDKHFIICFVYGQDHFMTDLFIWHSLLIIYHLDIEIKWSILKKIAISYSNFFLSTFIPVPLKNTNSKDFPHTLSCSDQGETLYRNGTVKKV